VTNESGLFRVPDLAAGTYPVQVKMGNYVTARKSVVIAAGQVTTWDVALRLQPFYSRAASTGPDPTPSELARGIYDAAIRRVQPPPTDLVIESVSMLPPILDDDEWTEQLAAVPQDLRIYFASAPNAQAVTLRASSFAPAASLMSFKDIDAGIGAGRIQTAFAFTRVFVTGDTLQALVGFRYHCGNLCGEGTLLWLSRPTTRAEWMIRGQKTFWVS